MDPITTILTAPAILALVTILRDLGLPSRFAPVGAIALGILLSVASTLIGHLPVYEAVVNGILLGLAAAGVYDASRLVGGKDSTAPLVEIVGAKPVNGTDLI